MTKLAGKIAVVTGASKGIGASIAKALAAHGATVVVNYSTSKEGADKVVAKIEQAGGKAVAIGGSVAKSTEIDALFAKTKDHFGKVDILVNNAGQYTFTPLETITEEGIDQLFNVNVKGLLLATKAAVALFPSEGGSIINIGSVVSESTPATGSVYSATKGAVDVITRSLAKELGPRNIRVNALNPGLTATEGNEFMRQSDMEKSMIAQTPLGRLGQPNDIADVAVFLASEDARWVTGALLQAGGGLR